MNPNHPEKGSEIRVSPIKNLKDIQKIKDSLKDKPRDLCLFTLGINTNLRIGDLLSIKVGQVKSLNPGDSLELRQQKRKRFAIRTINKAVYETIHNWLSVHPHPTTKAPLFPGKNIFKPITVPYASRLIKSWCRHLPGNYAAHTLRKTFGYHSRTTFNMPLPVITAAFGHSSQQTTLTYLCIQDEEVKELFMNEL